MINFLIELNSEKFFLCFEVILTILKFYKEIE